MTLRILITGSRDWGKHNARMVHKAILDEVYANDGATRHFSEITVMHGGANGADTIAAHFADCNGWNVEPYPARWTECAEDCPPGHRKKRADGTEYCPTAGHRRNQLMVDKGADVCLAFPLSTSRGTWDCVTRAKKAGIPVRVVKP